MADAEYILTLRMTQNITKIINEEKMMLETAALISSCYAPWALNYYMVAKPSQMTCLPKSLPSTSRIITKGSGRLCPKVDVEKWKRGEAYQSFDTFKHFEKKIACVCQ
jgi:hypothetical protein